MDEQEISMAADASSPADQAPPPFDFATLAALMQEHAQAGWVWSEKTHTLAHPQDGQLHFAVDPVTRQLTLSPQLARQLGDASGPPSQEGQP